MKKEYKEYDGGITPAQLDEMRANAQAMHDDLQQAGRQELEKTGHLTGARLAEMTTEYENYVLDIQRLELLLQRADLADEK